MRRIAASILVVALTSFPHAQTAGGQMSTPAVLPPRDNAAIPTGTAKVRGRVTTTDGQPLRRAVVFVTANEIAVRRLVTTDDQGRWEVTQLPQGRYTIGASKGTYVPLQYGQRRPFEPGRPVAVADGQVLERLDIALPAGSVIAGTVTDEFGEPLAGTQVNVQRYQYRPDGRRTLTPVPNGFFVTDDRGQFRAFALMPGEYIVSASMRVPLNTQAPAGVRDNADGYATTFYPGTTNAEEAQAVAVALGEEKPITFAMRAVHTAQISGTVTDSHGRPAVGADVMVSVGSGGSYRFMFGANVAADGSFTAANLPPGTHRIQVRGVTPVFGEPTESANVPVTLGGTDVTGLKIVTQPPATIVGALIFNGNASRTGPMPIRVTATMAMDDPGGLGFYDPSNGLLDGHGQFEIRGLTGSILLRPLLPPQWMMRSVTLDGANITDEPLDMTAQRTISGVVITLTDRVTDVAGTVTNARGEPVKEYAVIVVPAEEKVGMAQTRYVRVGRPDQDGRFDLRALPPGQYYATAVEMHEQGREWDPEFQRNVRQAGRSFSLREGETVSLQMKLTNLP